jgi:hypothetical protein
MISVLLLLPEKHPTLSDNMLPGSPGIGRRDSTFNFSNDGIAFRFQLLPAPIKSIRGGVSIFEAAAGVLERDMALAPRSPW